MVTEDYIKTCVPEGLNLYPFQYSGVQFLLSKRRALIASDPGCGKTVMLIISANCLYKALTKLKVLVVCPKSMCLTWEREIRKWGEAGIEWEIINWDKLVYEKWKSKLSNDKWEIIIADESHCGIKNGESQRGEFFSEVLVNCAQVVWLASATPASKSALDYFCTLQILMPRIFKDWSKWDFMKKFCEAVPDRWAMSGVRYEGFANTAELRKVLQRVVIRHRKEVVLPQLPEKTYTDMEVEIDRSVAAQHVGLNGIGLAQYLEDGKVLPGHIAQILQATALAKVGHCLEFVENFPPDEPLIIFCWHRVVVHKLKEELKKKGESVECITGEITNPQVRQNIVDKFMRREVKRLILNMQSGGVGLTLTAASTAVYIEFPWTPVYLIQSEDRIHRIGQDANKVNIIRLIGKDTIDEHVFSVLDSRVKAIKEVGV